MTNLILDCQQLNKSYVESQAGSSLIILKDLNFTLKPAETVAVIGRSGAGKSTFLHLLAGLELPTAGKVYFQGHDWQTISESERCQLRNRQMGFIYQFHHLLPEFTALENVAMPLLMGSMKLNQINNAAKEILQRIGLGQRLHHKISELSGGERQRVAIARALVTRPACVLADEPTGNLDDETADEVFDIMMALRREYQTALIIVTHDKQIAARMDTVLCLENAALGHENIE